jgi:hypothetical protein
VNDSGIDSGIVHEQVYQKIGRSQGVMKGNAESAKSRAAGGSSEADEATPPAGEYIRALGRSAAKSAYADSPNLPRLGGCL